MKREELGFDRPAALQAAGPPEARGLARDEVRLLASTERGHEHARFRDLPKLLPPGALLVVNDSATLPASLPARHPRLGPITVNVSTRYGGELYLVEPRPSADEPGPLDLAPGEPLALAGLPARLVAPHPGLLRLWFVRVPGRGSGTGRGTGLGDLGGAMARAGSPIRYAYLEPPYPGLDAYQTVFARPHVGGRPGEPCGSAEMPSAARPFSKRVLEGLRDRGVGVVPVTLHAGVSSHEVETERVEEQVLQPEPFQVPAATAEALNAARREGRPVVAVGTTVVRALESARQESPDGAGDGPARIAPAAGFTRLLVHPGRPVTTVDGLITGLHDPMASHLAMLHALAPAERVRGAYAEAVREGYLWHEFGDSHLLWR